MASFSEKIGLYLRTAVTEKFNKLPMSYFDTHQVGDILSRVTSDINRVSNVMLTGVNQMLSSLVNVLFGVVLLFVISPGLTWIVLGVLVVSSLATKWISEKNRKYSDEAQTQLGALNNDIEEFMTGNVIVKSFNLQEQATASIEEINHRHYKAFKKAQFINYAIYPVIRILNQVAFVISAVYGAVLVIQGRMSIGTVQAYLQYINQISEPITNFAYVINALQGAMASLERITDILDEDEMVPEQPKLTELADPQGKVEFNHVKFGYTKDKILMNDISFVAKPNEMIAIVGPTGAGKTTLVNLLMRFYELNDGYIALDDVKTTDMSRSAIRRIFGMVLQDTWLFEGTIAENIAYGKKEATRAEIIEAAKAAQCDFFISTLPDGYDTVISSEDSMVSQGQQQLLTIARILLADPAMLILDEATSSVDTRTEVVIQQAMKRAMKGRTSFIIAHRLSTIQSADLILVMKDGDIIETGTHEELLEKRAFYYDLYQSQFA